MKVGFSNKAVKKKHSVLKVLIILFMVMMGSLILIKILVGDFSGSDVWPFVLLFLAYGRLRRTTGAINFSENKMIISHTDADGGMCELITEQSTEEDTFK